MRVTIRIAAIACVLAAATPAFAQPSPNAGSGSAITIDIPKDSEAPEVSAAASPSDVKVGARFTLFITAIYADGVEVNLREPVDLGGAFEVTKRVSEDKPRADGKHVREWQLEVYAWELGDLQVPPIAVTFTVGGRAGQVVSNAVPVRISGVLGDSDDPKLLRGYAPPVDLKQHNWLWEVLVNHPVQLGIAIGLIIAAWMTLRRLRRRRRRVTTLVAASVPTMTRRRIDMTSERALQRLLTIEQSGVLDRDLDRKGGYADMAEVIRDYLAARYRLTTADLTTLELVRALRELASDRDRELVEGWLGRCDLVKYGGFRATAIDAHDVLELGRALIVATTAVPAKVAAA